MINEMDLKNYRENVYPQKNTMKKAKIIAIGGGKGGVGKTIVTSNLGVSLAWQRKKVIIIDADLGGANLHTCFGLPTEVPTISDYISQAIPDLKDTIVQTGIENLRIISGARDSLNIANITNDQKLKFMNAIKDLDADYILLDLGAGTSYLVIDFFLIADTGLLVMLPEPTSIENVYRFIKAAFYRKLRSLETSMGMEDLVASVMSEKTDEEIKTPLHLLNAIKEKDPSRGERLVNEMLKFNPKVVVNMVRTSADVDLGASVTFACKRYFGINVNFLGYVNYSNSIWQSIRNRKPLIVDFPNSTMVTSFTNIMKNLEGF